MEGTIMSFRRGRKTQITNQAIIHIESVDTKAKAEKLVGKKVTWIAPGKSKKELVGEIKAVHGNSGAMRALFATGIPGQAVSQKVKIE